MDIKDLELSEGDFNLLIKALDFLPESGLAGEMMASLITGMLPTDRNARSNMEAKEKARQRNREADKEFLKEECRILQGRLLVIRRKFLQEGALRQTGEILKGGGK